MLSKAKKIVMKLPGGPSVVDFVRRNTKLGSFKTSGDYWRDRYEAGGNSGEGSYGQLAEYKASEINAFVRERGIESVIELGCGDGNQLALAEYPSYMGLDVAPGAVRICRDRFADDPTKSFYLFDPQVCADRQGVFTAQLAMSLDVIFHLVEDETFHAYMKALCDAGRDYLIVYSSNIDRQHSASHVRHRCFTDWIEAHAPQWKLVDKKENPHAGDGDAAETSFADFYFFEREKAPA